MHISKPLSKIRWTKRDTQCNAKRIAHAFCVMISPPPISSLTVTNMADIKNTAHSVDTGKTVCCFTQKKFL